MLPVLERAARAPAAGLGRHDQARGDARGARARRGDDQRHHRACARRARSRPSRRADAAVCLMHMQGEPRTMQADPDVRRRGRRGARRSSRRASPPASAAGIARERIVVDPGFGFGKTVEHNLDAAARACATSRRSGCRCSPAGRASRSLGTDHRPRAGANALRASVAAALLAVQRGARIVRVHDVAATRDALAVLARGAKEAP